MVARQSSLSSDQLVVAMSSILSIVWLGLYVAFVWVCKLLEANHRDALAPMGVAVLDSYSRVGDLAIMAL